MVKQIIRQLLEQKGAISSQQLSQNIQHPLVIVEEYLFAIDEMLPGLLLLTYNYDKTISYVMVRIAENGEDEAKRLLDSNIH